MVADSALVVRDARGNPYRIIGAMQDITERIQKEIVLKELNGTLNKRAAELAASNAELEQFAYIASHDLQEPLRMVTGFLTQIQKKYEPQLDETGQVYIKFAVDGAIRMRRIILDLLEYSRVGRQQYFIEKINTDELLKEACRMYTGIAKVQKIIINYKGLPDIVAAKTPVQQVFQNLISNAVKYQQPGNIPEIKINAADNEDHWQFAVEDNGIGIDTAYLDTIFVIFKRLHSKDEYSGTGIGLAICKKIIDNHQGKIWVESAPGKGSTFYFTISKHLPVS
jgi:light-regulated signal transduction histidine kinase (bacteriophytochrome)